MSKNFYEGNVKKSDFIEYPLQEFILRLDDSVKALAYEYDQESREEYCKIQYKNGFSRRVCISADSERAITVDVLKKL